jgi:hypothetical protein
MKSLIDQFCPHVHEAALIAADFDHLSGTIATGDADGMVSLRRGGDSVTTMGLSGRGSVDGSLALSLGGELLVIGDDTGSIGVYETAAGRQIFFEERQGPRGRSRAFRGVAINQQGTLLASISIDRILRVWDLQKHERLFQWVGYSGSSIHFDARGERILAITEDGQPNLINIWRSESQYLEPLQSPCNHVLFSPDGTLIIAAGPAGFYVLEVATGALIGGQATQSSSGIAAVVVSPDGTKIGTITGRSIHTFLLPDLQFEESYSHRTPQPTGAAVWTHQGIKVGGIDGLLHGKESAQGIAPIHSLCGFGSTRVALHGHHVAIWKKNRRKSLLLQQHSPRAARVNRDGTLMVLHPAGRPIEVYESRSGKRIMEGPPQSSDCSHIEIGGSTVCVNMPTGGCMWWNLAAGTAFQLPWPQSFCLSNGGDLLAMVTPKGRIQVLNSATGKSAMPSPKPVANSMVKTVAFINRSPMLLALDRENVLTVYDLAPSVKDGSAANGRDIIQIEADPDKLWGVTLGTLRLAVLRIQNGETSTLLWVPIDEETEPWTVEGLHPEVWVEPNEGTILEPARSAAILERTPYGEEAIVIRSLPDEQWISFGPRGVLHTSEQAGQQLR